MVKLCGYVHTGEILTAAVTLEPSTSKAQIRLATNSVIQAPHHIEHTCRKAKTQYLLTCKKSRYCLLALHCNVRISTLSCRFMYGFQHFSFDIHNSLHGFRFDLYVDDKGNVNLFDVIGDM